MHRRNAVQKKDSKEDKTRISSGLGQAKPLDLIPFFIVGRKQKKNNVTNPSKHSPDGIRSEKYASSA